MKIKIKPAYNEIDRVKDLFEEYTRMLGVNLAFQDYEDELNHLPGKYGLPEGRLYIAYAGDDPAGCVALRKVNEILFAVVGLGNLASAYMFRFKLRYQWCISGVIGGALVIWIVVQCIMLQAIVGLHVLYFIIGLIQIVLSTIILLDQLHHGPSVL